MRPALTLSPRTLTHTPLLTSLKWGSAGTVAMCAVFAITLFYQGRHIKGVLPGFSWRKEIQVHPDQVAGKAPLPDYAMLVNLTDPDLRSVKRGGKVASSTGQDLRFTRSDGSTLLPYEIESYNSGTGELRAWVQLDTLWAHRSTTTYLYFGNESAAQTGSRQRHFSEILLSSTPDATPGDDRATTLTHNLTAPENFYAVRDTEALDPTYPVKISHYQTRLKKDIGVLIEWTSEQERENEAYLIERSTDGNQFRLLGKVGGAGNSDIRLNYTFLDKNPVAGRVYYRLRQVSKADTYTDVAISEILINPDDPGLEILSVLPNPFTDHFVIQFHNSTDTAVRLDIYNAAGESVLSEKIQSRTGANQYTYEAPADLPPGIYVVSMIGKDGNLRTQILTLEEEKPEPETAAESKE